MATDTTTYTVEGQVCIDDIVSRDEQISLAEAALLMRGRGQPHPAVDTVRKWANPRRGCSVGGRTLILMSSRVGGEVITCKRWVEAFERARLSVGMRKAGPVLRSRTPRQRRLAHERAERNLDAAGVGTSSGPLED